MKEMLGFSTLFLLVFPSIYFPPMSPSKFFRNTLYNVLKSLNLLAVYRDRF